MYNHLIYEKAKKKRNQLLKTYHKKIVIEKFSGSKPNENGFPEEEWEFFCNIWCNFRNVSGKEFISAKAENSENIVTFTFRYFKKINEMLNPGASKKFRILYNENYYNIIFISDFNDEHNEVDIKAKIIS
ncbi:phage head closure protein [Clostridium sp. B9]|uniref:phage head closure protein n=1 Tax=Clostridium sp. B9 TaxID=3423224 RepID=UPI003D2ECE08